MKKLWIVFLLSCVILMENSRCAMTGGWSEAKVNDENVQNISRFVKDKMASDGICSESLELVKASRQIVAGEKYTLDYIMEPKNCPNGDKIGSRKNCRIVVWEKKWQQFRRIVDQHCEEANVTNAAPSKLKRLSLIGGGTHDIGNMGLFKKFIKKYNKMYKNDKEFIKRFKVFRKNMKKVKLLQDGEQGTAVYGATPFADLTEKEFRQQYLGLRPDLAQKASHMKEAEIPSIDIPDSYDWRAYNVVTPVKNQGMCGSCWAFSVTGNVEGQWAIQKQQLLDLSEQELVDCDTLDKGCEGGYMTNAYEQIISLGGLETETDYPYDGEDEQCKFAQAKAQVTISGYVNISQDEADMAQWLVQNGPISIGINANAMQFYFGGVSHPWKFLCNPDSLDHGVLIVGYGVTTSAVRKKPLPYWIVKNSWGSYWGEKGYYRVYRGDGTCGVNLMASSATV